MKLEMTFEGMTCLECAKKLEKALRSVSGVEGARLSYPNRSGSVEASDEVSRDDLLRVVEQAGYRAEITADGRTAAPIQGRALEAGGAHAGAGDYDLVILGTGGAGMAAAIRASELGARVAIVERAEVMGGTCVNIGCIPSKFLIEAAHHVHVARTAFPGISACEPHVAWTEALRRKREIVETLRQEKYLDVLASYEGVSLVRGQAKLLGGGRVQVGNQELRARRIIVATGTRPAMPPIPGLTEAGALDSTTAMELQKLPESMVVIGGGSIGLELGQAFARFGVRIVVIEALPRILPNEDPALAEALAGALRAEGIEIHVGVRVTEVRRDDVGVVVQVHDGSVAGEIRVAAILVATGRVPNTQDLGLQDAGVEVDANGFIQVDEFMRTTSPGVYAAGDVTGGPGYVYVAAYGGGIAAQAALAESSRQEAIPADLSATPRVTFTDPQVAAVGMTEDEARAAGIRTKVAALPMEYLPRAIVSERRQGLIKLVADAESDVLLGAHILGPNAGDVIGEATLAIRFGLRVQEVVSTLHPYLTWGEGIRLAGQTFTKDIAQLSCCA